jgi:hypothetical protein
MNCFTKELASRDDLITSMIDNATPSGDKGIRERS